MQQPVCGRQDRVKSAHMVCAEALQTLVCLLVCLLVWSGAGCWEVGFGGQTQGRDSCWL